MGQEATIKSLILAAAEGAGAGVSALQSLTPPIPVKLEEFEIEVSYAATTEVTSTTEGHAGISFGFSIVKASFGVKRSVSRKSTETYGLKVRFIFSGIEEDKNPA